jgi:TIR domain
MTEPPLAWDVFISYTHADRSIGEVLQQDLQAAGFRVWRDAPMVRPGCRVRAAVNEGLRHSAIVLVLISSRSLASEWVLNELDAAMMREIRERRTVVIPALIGQVSEELIPDDLKGKLYLDLRHNFKKRYARVRDQLHAAIAAASRAASGSPEIEVPVGDELMGRLMAHQFVWRAMGGVPTGGEVQLAEACIHAYDGLYTSDEEIEYRDGFVERYGRWGLRQILLYEMDINDLDFRHFTEEQIGNVLEGARLILVLFALERTLYAGSGRRLLMVRLQGSEKPAFRLLE